MVWWCGGVVVWWCGGVVVMVVVVVVVMVNAPDCGGAVSLCDTTPGLVPSAHGLCRYERIEMQLITIVDEPCPMSDTTPGPVTSLVQGP